MNLKNKSTVKGNVHVTVEIRFRFSFIGTRIDEHRLEKKLTAGAQDEEKEKIKQMEEGANQMPTTESGRRNKMTLMLKKWPRNQTDRNGERENGKHVEMKFTRTLCRTSMAFVDVILGLTLIE